jgi:glycosyltransferase involved in cell wall biosynthesis
MEQQPENYPNVHFTGYLPEADKIAIIRHSAGLIFPSFSEGFGIPIVEGAVLGVPVLCSDIPVFREIGGKLATYFDPYKPASLQAAIKGVLANPKVTQEMAEALHVSVLNRFSQSAMAERLSAFLGELGFKISAEELPAK